MQMSCLGTSEITNRMLCPILVVCGAYAVVKLEVSMLCNQICSL